MGYSKCLQLIRQYLRTHTHARTHIKYPGGLPIRQAVDLDVSLTTSKESLEDMGRGVVTCAIRHFFLHLLRKTQFQNKLPPPPPFKEISRANINKCCHQPKRSRKIVKKNSGFTYGSFHKFWLLYPAPANG